MNYKDKCRTCLCKEKEMRHVHTAISIAGHDVLLSDILQNFYDFKISSEDYLPQYICINCVHQLTTTYSFKILIDSTAKTILEHYNIVECISDNNYECSGLESEEDNKKLSNNKEYPNITGSRNGNIKVQRNRNIYNNELTLLFCVECKCEFDSARSLNEHCTNNHPAKSAVGRDCDYCNEKFEDFRSLVLHRKLHLKPYLCENCWEGFFNADDLKKHSCVPNIDKKDKHKSSDRDLQQCDQCGKSYPPGYIKIHMLTHSNDRRYSCKFCPKKFKVPGGLHSHILWNHKRTRNHKCEVCNATFITSSSKSSHVRKNHLKEKKYGCDSCGKRFFSKSELQRHSLTHTGVKNFHCHMCDKSYQTRYGLNVHLKSHTQLSNNMSVLGL